MHTSVDVKVSFFNFVPRASQLPSLFLAISYTIVVILLDIANVFQILISASWFWRNSRGIWVILILFCWNHRNNYLKWSVGFCLDQCTISHRAFSLTWRTSTLIYWEKRVYIRKELTPTGLVWNTNMAAVSFFWNNNMAAVTSCENAILNWLEITFRILDFPLYHLQVNWFSLHFKKSSGKRAERPAKLICPWT